MTQQDDRAVPVSEAAREMAAGLSDPKSQTAKRIRAGDADHFSEVQAFARFEHSIRATQAPAGVELPEDWVAVPKQLTDEMAKAGAKGRQNSAISSFRDGWKFALAAAPILTPPAQSSGPGEVERLRSAMLVTRGSIGDLRKGFAKSVDPERWVQQAIAHIDKALTPNASEPQPGADDCDCKLCDWVEKRPQEQPQPGAASSGERTS